MMTKWSHHLIASCNAIRSGSSGCIALYPWCSIGSNFISPTLKRLTSCPAFLAVVSYMSASSPESVGPVFGCPSSTTIFLGLWSLKNPISLVYLNHKALVGFYHRRTVVFADILRFLRHDAQSRHEQVVDDFLHDGRFVNRRRNHRWHRRSRNNNRRRHRQRKRLVMFLYHARWRRWRRCRFRHRRRRWWRWRWWRSWRGRRYGPRCFFFDYKYRCRSL